jgi:beta-phosphoglucomutase-like phosphatase (HAD superfamily)
MNTLGLKGNEVLIFEDSIAGIRAAENAKAGQIVIVNSTDDDYSNWKYPIIKNFMDVDRSIFK